MEFKISQKLEGDVLRLTVEGSIDEDAVFPNLDLSKIKSVELDLKGVTAINSVGIREWMEWIKPVAAKAQIRLHNCPKALVFQLNMVDGFLPPNSSVSSFYVPFFCEKCDREESVLFTVGKEVTGGPGGAKISFDSKTHFKCAEATCEMAMDATESKYFQFLRRS